MKHNRLNIVIILVTILIAVVIISFIICFAEQQISNNISDWAALGGYIGGIISPIISALNVYLFYILTKATTKFTEENTRKQLFYGTCNDYQRRINELVFDCINDIQSLNAKEESSPSHQKVASSILKISLYADSFYNEVEPFLKNKDDIKQKKDEFQDAARMLTNSPFNDSNKFNEFIQKKSELIKVIFENIL